MTIEQEIKDHEAAINRLKAKRALNADEHIKMFRSEINQRISETPTGELRNKFTDLNILFEAVLVSLL